MDQDRININTGSLATAGGPCCNMTERVSDANARWAKLFKTRVDEENVKRDSLSGADLLRVLATTSLGDTKSRMLACANAIERLSAANDERHQQLFEAIQSIQSFQDRVGRLNAVMEQKDEEVAKLKADLVAARKRKTRRRARAKA